jgi:serine/threonine protein kinase/tetratricopeptide (TPR) repeat protein
VRTNFVSAGAPLGCRERRGPNRNCCSRYFVSGGYNAATVALTPGDRLGPYEIVEPLGAGGMGEVYRARDTRLGRTVAIKILTAEFSADEAQRLRFEREARIISHLNHPHICVLHDVGNQDGMEFLVMECVEGQTLAQRLGRGPLSIEQVLKYGAQIADALAAAHAQGVVHRDVKPANIFITLRDDVKVLDFGLAKRDDVPDPSAATVTLALSEAGSVLGTAAYMSPEQARGEALDARTDLFSLGSVLYEMTAGRRAFDGRTHAVVFNAILNATPTPASEFRKDIPQELERILDKALAKDREVRYHSASDMKVDLLRLKRDLESGIARAARSTKRRNRRIVTAVASLLVLAAGAVAFPFVLKSRKAFVPAGLTQQTTVAVLPFRNAAGDAKLEYLATALPDEVITMLSYAPTLSVRPFSMSQRFSGNDSDPHEAGRQLRVANVVTGHFLSHADRLTVTLEAMDVAKQEVVWRTSLDVVARDVLKLREDVTNTLEKGLLPALGVRGGELSSTKPKSQEAYDLYLRSQDSAYDIEHNKQAIALLEKSVALDPGYAPAWLELGSHYYTEADMVEGSDTISKKCIAALERAHELDPNLLSASTSLIEFRRRVGGDLATSFTQLQELSRRRPRRAEVHVTFSQLLRTSGALEQSANACEVAHQLDPDLPTDCYITYIYLADYAKARREIERSPGEFSSFVEGHILLREGKADEALPKLKILPAASNYEVVRECWRDSSTEKCSALVTRSESEFLHLPDPDAWYFGAALFAALGKKEASLRLLEADRKLNFCVYPAVDRDPMFDKTRETADFKAARQAGIECQQRYAQYANMPID